MVRTVMTRLLVGVVPCLGGLLFLSSLPAGAASNVPAAAREFSACVLSHQAGKNHKATLAEARQCAPSSSREVRASNIESGRDSLAAGETAVLVRKDGSAALVGWSAGPDLVANIVSGCYNSWANPQPWGSSGIDYVQIDVHGYGNHCGYSDVPTTPSVYATCYIPWCNAYNIEKGHYDSNQGAAWFNDQRAAGWANIYFNIGDTWFCRGYIDTNGNPNWPQWCS